MSTTNLVVSRILNTSVEQAWNAWVDPALVMQWWAPDGFTSPSAHIDFKEGGTSIVCMRPPQAFGGGYMYSSWKYIAITPYTRFEFIHNICDQNGVAIDPTTIGLPAGFPKDLRMTAEFEDVKEGTKVTVTQYDWDSELLVKMQAEAGLNQSMDKMVKIFQKEV